MDFISLQLKVVLQTYNSELLKLQQSTLQKEIKRKRLLVQT
jgi:hypothetical protein